MRGRRRGRGRHGRHQRRLLLLLFMITWDCNGRGCSLHGTQQANMISAVPGLLSSYSELLVVGGCAIGCESSLGGMNTVQQLLQRLGKVVLCSLVARITDDIIGQGDHLRNGCGIQTPLHSCTL